ncbi:MAG TPA: nucleotide-binding protein [Clostridiales bacterium]|nr:nucleotide-binding protein [Clostridiales bacterium]
MALLWKEPSINVIIEKLKDNFNKDCLSFDVFEYCCKEIHNWYNRNISSLINSHFYEELTYNMKKMDNILEDISANREKYEKVFSLPVIEQKNSLIDDSNIFIVHGRDDGIKNEVARFIEKLKLNPIILHEQSSGGDTIIEKIERYSNVGFGIVLYTPCDKGGLANEHFEAKFRARQNVVFEHGYLIGKLGRKKVVALVKDNVEKPNDISGIVYVNYDLNGAWKTEIAKELHSSGYPIDFNDLLK